MPTASGGRAARVNVLAAARSPGAAAHAPSDGFAPRHQPPLPSPPRPVRRVRGAPSAGLRHRPVVTARSAGPRAVRRTAQSCPRHRSRSEYMSPIGHRAQPRPNTLDGPEHTYTLRPNGEKSTQKSTSKTLITRTSFVSPHDYNMNFLVFIFCLTGIVFKRKPLSP